MPWTTDEWKGCYPSSWKGMIVPEAMAHPAKFSSKLIRRIYEHMRAEKWVKPGDRVIDPFGGVALGALDAMRLGLEWLGMELEVKFVDLGNHNISNWELKFGKSMPNWGSARLVQGDSRKMLENLGRGRAAVSSPPYADSINSDGSGIDWSKRADISKRKNNGFDGSAKTGEILAGNYGSTPGQLGTMKDNGDARAQAMISSPPYADGSIHQGGEDRVFDNSMTEKYGETEGQLGQESGSDFWTAARQIVEQVYLALAPGGHAVWVVKNYVKNKQMVPFSDQWRQLCEAVGFETLHEHRAVLVHATSLTLDGKEVHKESKSFFRRLAEKKGSPRIDFETVWCMVKR